jgi:hypothetical protein
MNLHVHLFTLARKYISDTTVMCIHSFLEYQTIHRLNENTVTVYSFQANAVFLAAKLSSSCYCYVHLHLTAVWYYLC